VDEEVLDELIAKLLSKLQSSMILVDSETHVPVRITEMGQLLTTTMKKSSDTWNISFKGIVPEELGSYFWYYENTEDKPISLTCIKLVSSVGGVDGAYVTVHRVSGDLQFKNVTSVNAISLTNTESILSMDSRLSVNITDILNSEQVERIDIEQKNKSEELLTKIVLRPGEKVALRWNSSIGSISGTITISKEV